ncbi:MAG: flagellar biosynthesis protein FlhB [Dissulfurispiraceae bacterium]|jgi:flagellar biosynthetic protein FlhB|nr:flagellar biosynthesis protein FlhB [Dissulfurispiraceae bacterium]
MAEEDKDQKTEQATPQRKQKAREKGDIPKSREITSIIPIWVVYAFLSFSGIIFTSISGYVASSLRRSFSFELTPDSLMNLFITDTSRIGLIMMPMFFTMVGLIILVHFVQTRFLLTAKPLTPEFGRLNPFKGIKKFFSINIVVELVKGVLKMFILGAFLYTIIKNEIFTLPLLVNMDLSAVTFYAFGQIKHLVMISAMALTVFAAADFGYQIWHTNRSQRMTKQEVKDEYKDIEGDPRVKARIKSLQRDMMRKRMMQEVPQADVVITNPTHYAVALKYDPKAMGAPRVVAKGANMIAQKIKEIAIENKVPVFEEKPLARALYLLDIGQEIPEAMYKAVAAILANVYKLKRKVMKG